MRNVYVCLVCMCVRMCVCMILYVTMSVWMYACVSVCLPACLPGRLAARVLKMYVCTYISCIMHVCVCMYVCMHSSPHILRGIPATRAIDGHSCAIWHLLLVSTVQDGSYHDTGVDRAKQVDDRNHGYCSRPQ